MNPQLALQLTLVVPLAGALLIALAGRWPNLREAVTLATAGALFYLVFQVFLAVGANSDPNALYVELFSLLPGLSIALHSEPLSILFALVASGLWIVTSVYAIGYMRANQEKHQTRFYVCFAVAIFGAMGVAFAANLLTLFLFYEVLTLSTYPLVAHKGDDKARAGARTYLGILLATSIGLFLPAMLWTYAVAGTLDFRAGGILEGTIGGTAATVLLLLYLFGIGFRMPITMGAFAIAALSMIGVPPTGGFVSKWYMIAGAFQNDSYFVLGVLSLSTALNAAYFLPVIFRAFFRRETEAPAKSHGEAPLPMVAAICVTATLTLLVFFLNGPLVAFETAVLGATK